MKYLKRFNEEEVIQENWVSKIKTSLTGAIPEIEKLVKELPEKIIKNQAKHDEVKEQLYKYNLTDVKSVKSTDSENSVRIDYSEENFLAIAAYYNFNIGILRPVKGVIQIRPVDGITSKKRNL